MNKKTILAAVLAAVSLDMAAQRISVKQEVIDCGME